MLLKEAKAHKVAREEKLDNQLPIGWAVLIETDRAGLDPENVRPGIARPEEELVSMNGADLRIGRLGRRGACVAHPESRLDTARNRALLRPCRTVLTKPLKGQPSHRISPNSEQTCAALDPRHHYLSSPGRSDGLSPEWGTSPLQSRGCGNIFRCAPSSHDNRPSRADIGSGLSQKSRHCRCSRTAAR